MNRFELIVEPSLVGGSRFRRPLAVIADEKVADALSKYGSPKLDIWLG